MLTNGIVYPFVCRDRGWNAPLSAHLHMNSILEITETLSLSDLQRVQNGIQHSKTTRIPTLDLFDTSCKYASRMEMRKRFTNILRSI